MSVPSPNQISADVPPPLSFSLARRTLTVVALVCLPLLFFYPAVLGQVLLAPGDGWTQIFGLRVLIGQMIAEGQLPLWNPYIFAGMPLLASIQVGAFYPLTWLFAVLPPGIAMNAMVISTYHIALIGAYLYARRIGANRAGGLVTGIAFTFGGFMLTHLGHTNRVAAAAWLPWILLAIAHLHLRWQWRWVTLGALFVALQLFAGDPQMTLYTAMLSGGYWLFLLFARGSGQPRLRFLIATGTMALCGTLLSAVVLLPEWEMLKQGERAQIPYEYFSLFSLPPQQLLSLIFPYFFGGAYVWPYRIGNWGLGNFTETASYVGLLTLLLAGAALGHLRQHKIVFFWLLVAALSLALAFGSYLPWGLHRGLYAIPVYNLFRASGRHLLEFNFALAVLAGLGLTYFSQMERPRAQRLFLFIAILLSSLVGATAMIYVFFGSHLARSGPPPTNAFSRANFEFILPLIFFVLSLASGWFYVRTRDALAAALLIVLLVADMGAFGFFYEWRIFPYSLTHRVGDPPAVQFIKAREPNLTTFRVANHTAWPQSFGASMLEDSYVNLNYPNVSVLRGLQMVNGYDPVRLLRTTDISGAMSLDGMLEDATVLGPQHQGFNLLNVKYLLQEKRGAVEPGRGVVHEGIRFSEAVTNIKLLQDRRIELLHAKAMATELAIVSALANSGQIAQGTPLAQIKLFTTEGKVIERELQAGRDSSEWAWDRPDVRATAKHQRAQVAESYPAEGFEAHRYLARLPFDRAEIARIEISSLLPKAELLIARATLHDATTDTSVQIDGEALPPERWRKLESFGNVEVYENLHHLPRAWLVNRIEVRPRDEVVQTIKSGAFSDGTPFDPQTTALLELEDFGGQPFSLPPTGAREAASVKITQYKPQRIKLETENAAPSFLVLSEIYYRGWEARIDGAKAPVYRVNHTLRGLALPAGKHQIEFAFRAPSLKTGARYLALGLLILVVGGLVSLSGARTETKSEGFLTRSRAKVRQGFEAWRSPTSLGAAEKIVLPLSSLRQAFIPLLIALGLGALLYFYASHRFAIQPIRSDGIGYYIYLPAAFLHKDISLETTIKKQFNGKAEEWMGVIPYPATGRYLNRYALGEAVLLSPFFLVGHGLAKVLHLPANGFSWPYQLAMVIAGFFYFIVGLMLLRRVLERHFSTATTLLTLLVMTFGTNLFHYATSDNIFSHIYSFFLFCTLLFLTENWYESGRRLTAILLAVVAGLITIVRPPNSVFLLLVPLLGLHDRASLLARLNFYRQQMQTIALCLGVYFLTLLPLLSYWKYVTGHWIVNSYQELVFNWTKPEIVNVLFSVRKGLFFWSPILLLCGVGFYFLARYWKGFLLPALVVLLVHGYIVASWPAWWFGGSFGHRAFTETLPIFGLGYAALLEATREKPLLYRSVLAVSALLVLLSVKFMMQYWNGVLPYDEATLQGITTTFFQFAK